MRKRILIPILVALTILGIFAAIASAHWQGRTYTNSPGTWFDIHSGIIEGPAHIDSTQTAGLPENYRVSLWSGVGTMLYESPVHYQTKIGSIFTDNTGQPSNACSSALPCKIKVVAGPYATSITMYVDDYGLNM